jgi:hypothetical protein
VVAEIDEKEATMVALAMNPPRKADNLVFMGKAELATGMGTIRMHDKILGLFG